MLGTKKDKYIISQLSNIPVPKTVGSGSTKNASKGWGTRHTFLIMGFLGFVLCYALRFNLSIAIVAMVEHSQPTSESDPTISLHENFNRNGSNHEIREHSKSLNQTHVPFKPSTICNANDSQPISIVKRKSKAIQNKHKGKKETTKNSPTGPTFAWSEKQQGLILGSFFWGYVITQYPGGRLSDKYGPKWIFSVGILITGLLSLITPIITEMYDATGLIVVRILQGLAEGVTLPSILVMLAHWSPFEERSRMTNWIYAGIPIGTAVIMITGGYLIHFMGWMSVFYVSGIASIIWFVFWCFLTFNDPSEHPRISFEELSYIQSQWKGETIQKDLPTPWRSILTSLPVWAIFVADLGDSWSHYLLHVEVPIYLSSVHGFDIEASGWLSALPQGLNCVFAILVSYISDFIIMRQITSVIFTRKICSTIALWGSALGFVGMIFGGCNTYIAVCSLNFAAMISGASNCGWTVNNIEIAPNHAGTISGVANSFGNCLGFVAPYVTGLILDSYPSLYGWKLALMIPAVISFFVNIFFWMTASAEEQTWNKPNSSITDRKDTNSNSSEVTI